MVLSLLRRMFALLCSSLQRYCPPELFFVSLERITAYTEKAISVDIDATLPSISLKNSVLLFFLKLFQIIHKMLKLNIHVFELCTIPLSYVPLHC